MKEIKQYLVKRLEKLNYELGYFEDDDEGCNLASAKAVNEEITEVNNLLILFDVVASLPSKTELNWIAIDEVEKLRLLPDYDGKQDEIIGFSKGFSKCYEILTK